LADDLADLNLTEEEKDCFGHIDLTKCPRHIAFIMDGNGRWAAAQGKSRTTGHRQGVSSVYEMVDMCGRLPVEYATFYAFSTENWRRSSSEVRALMALFSSSLQKYLHEMLQKDVRIEVIGDIEGMGRQIRDEFQKAREMTANCRKICMTLALNYSGRSDLVRACRKIVGKVQTGQLSSEKIDDTVLSQHLDTAFLPEPELLIRTSGEMRLSNFLLWECAYTEFYFADVHWPDFRRLHLFKAIADYQRRQRRFGSA
jgi:undecaprenyl diphosphate synthase